MFAPMPPRLGAVPPGFRPPTYAAPKPLQYGLLDAFMYPQLEPISSHGGLLGVWGAAAAANPQSLAAAAQNRTPKPVGNFQRLTIWDPNIGAYVPVVVDKAGDRLHPFVAGLIDQLVAVDPNSDQQIDQARLAIDQLLTDSPQTRNFFHHTFSDFLAGDLTPEEARAEFGDRGDERFRANRATANLFAEGILAAEGVRQAAPVPAGPQRQIPVPRAGGVPRESEPLPSTSHTKDPITEAEYRALPEEGLIDPHRIRTLQDSISQRFRPEGGATSGKHIKETIDELRSGTTRPEDIPAVRTTLLKRGVWSADHRRLVAARLAGVPVRYRKVVAESLKKEIKKKATTADDGMSIVITPDKER